MSNEKRFIGTFHTETELVTKVQDLKAKGVSDDNIYVIAKNKDQLHMLRSRTDAEVKTTEESWFDKFRDFMTGEDRINGLLGDLGLSDAEKDRYYTEVNNGGMLLYVDEGEAGTLHRDRFGMDTGATDPNLGANANVDPDLTTGRPGTEGAVGATGAAAGSVGSRSGLRSTGNPDRVTEDTPETMKVHEERLNVDKQQVKKGEVKVDKNVVTDHESVDVPVEHEEITVERRPVDGTQPSVGSDTPKTGNAFGEETIRVPVTEEKVEVTKKPVVTEEIVINKKKVTDTKHVDETVRREEVDIEREGQTKDVNFKGEPNDPLNRRKNNL